MSDSYENVVGGRLKLKGKALDVKAASGGIKKKKKKKQQQQQDSYSSDQSKRRADSNDQSSASVGSGASTQGLDEPIIQEEEVGDAGGGGKSTGQWDDHLTPAERRYVEQKARIDMHSLAKTANKSHRDRIQDFNQYLANLSEHYDIPKVGPG